MSTRARVAPAPWLAALAALAISLGNGCGGAVPAARYYVIDYEIEAKNQVAPLDLVLGVEPFSTQPLYRDRRIAHRASDYEVVYYPYSYWAAMPGELVADRLANHLRRSGVVRGVEMAPFGSPPDWLLGGHVQQFEEVVRGGRTVARLELSVRLERVRERQVLREEQIAVEKPLAGRGPQHVAAAMSGAVREAGERLAGLLLEIVPQP